MGTNKGTPLRAYREVYPKYTRRDYERRGEIISRTVNLERIIDTVIASYFCHDTVKRDELLFLLLSTERISWENKRQIMQWILEKYAPDLKKQYPDIFKDLQEIGEFRNVLAHNHLDTEGFVQYEAQKTTVINKYKNKKIVIEITEELFKQKINLLNQYTTVLMHWEGILYFPL